MFLTGQEFVALRLQNIETEKGLKNLQEASRLEKENAHMKETEDIYALMESRNKANNEYTQFVQETKKSLLAECLMGFLEESTFYQSNKVQADVIQRNLVNQFINEQGVDSLLHSMKEASYVLSEFSRVINKHSKIIVEKAEKGKPETYFIIPEDRDSFFDDLKTEDAEAVSSMIKLRVSDALDSFIQSNIKQKEEIKEVLTHSKQRMEVAKSEDIKEAYNNMGKRAIQDIRDKRMKTVLEAMIVSISESAIKSEALKGVYTNEGKLNMDAIVENATIMYAFLETLNTTKLIKIDESYIQSVITGLES